MNGRMLVKKVVRLGFYRVTIDTGKKFLLPNPDPHLASLSFENV